ncbi:hypothetical protein K435DRAFT_849228 [Dendrothele bispora CBS 962.96]|uniref:Uncharacterized protein n=1 Tax=Dendrothele bispora (strain CBS 962.96) TaxID=1314807 RepID=A0A4S8MSJ8_DENBC|nr:hypothetical protein K435DRAFT_849228 [Dendrothele bispora CBS 962.96]
MPTRSQPQKPFLPKRPRTSISLPPNPRTPRKTANRPQVPLRRSPRFSVRLLLVDRNDGGCVDFSDGDQAPLCSTAPATGIEIAETFPVVRRSPPPVTQAQAPAVEIAETLPAVRCSPPPVTQAQGPVLPTHAPPFDSNADSDETQSNAHAQVILVL